MAAAAYVLLPACVASMVQVPAAMKLAVVPLIVQTLAVVEANETGSPEVAVADSVSGVPTVCGPGLAKVIVCAARTVTVAVCAVVAPAELVTVRV
jgi:hypothetical protein